MEPRLSLAAALALPLALAACGGSSKHASAPPAVQSARAATTAAKPPATTRAASPSPLQAESKSAATGDIPDNQVFLVFRNGAAGYSMKYPEGWAQRGSGGEVTFRDKNNIVRVVVRTQQAPTAASVRSDLRSLANTRLVSGPQPLALGGGRTYRVVYSTTSAPNPVTGKQVTLAVDRYYLAHGGRVAVVDLGTPRGVDNVDAYRLMIDSFRWR